jgi:hypothetical protein
MSRKAGRKQTRDFDTRQEKFAAGIALGKTKVAAALDAGYAPSTALKKSYAIVKPIVDGLDAKLRVKTLAGVIETEWPDHRIRGENADRAIRLLGGIPRETEMPAPARPGLIVIIGRESEQGRAATAKPIDRPTPPGKMFDVTFRRETPDCDQGNTNREP